MLSIICEMCEGDKFDFVSDPDDETNETEALAICEVCGHRFLVRLIYSDSDDPVEIDLSGY